MPCSGCPPTAVTVLGPANRRSSCAGRRAACARRCGLRACASAPGTRGRARGGASSADRCASPSTPVKRNPHGGKSRNVVYQESRMPAAPYDVPADDAVHPPVDNLSANRGVFHRMPMPRCPRTHEPAPDCLATDGCTWRCRSKLSTAFSPSVDNLCGPAKQPFHAGSRQSRRLTLALGQTGFTADGVLFGDPLTSARVPAEGAENHTGPARRRRSRWAHGQFA